MAKADPLVPDQIQKFANVAEQHYSLMYAALFVYQVYTLARIEEARRVVRGDLLNDDGIVKHKIYREIVKKKKPVKTPFELSMFAMRILQAWLDISRTHFGRVAMSEPVFVSGFKSKSINPRSVNRAYAQIALKCGFREHVSSHTPRVSGAIILFNDYKKTMDDLDALEMVRDMLGHEKIDTTRIYLRLKQADRHHAASVFENVFTKGNHENN
jgi:integrase